MSHLSIGKISRDTTRSHDATDKISHEFFLLRHLIQNYQRNCIAENLVPDKLNHRNRWRYYSTELGSIVVYP